MRKKDLVIGEIYYIPDGDESWLLELDHTEDTSVFGDAITIEGNKIVRVYIDGGGEWGTLSALLKGRVAFSAEKELFYAEKDKTSYPRIIKLIQYEIY